MILVLLHHCPNDVWFDPNVKDDEGATPLHLAATLNCAAVVQTLLRDGRVLPNPLSSSGTTPLYDALAGGHVEATQALLDDSRVDLFGALARFRGGVSNDAIQVARQRFVERRQVQRAAYKRRRDEEENDNVRGGKQLHSADDQDEQKGF